MPPGLLEQLTRNWYEGYLFDLRVERNHVCQANQQDGAYDLVVPSTYYVDKMRKEGMIQY